MKEIIKSSFNRGVISKAEYIDKMYIQHQILFEYSNMLNNVDLDSVLIKQDGIYFTSKKDKIILYCTKPDKRTAPFEILNFDDYESCDANLFYGLIKNGDTVFDIGANIGWYSIGIAKRNPDSVIHAFEPLPSTFGSLVKNVSINKINNIVLNNFGLSDDNKIIRFYSSKYTSVSNSAENICGESDIDIVDCEVKSMDSYLFTNELTVDVIKCDVEGAELFTFKGAEKTIATHKPIIFSEMLRKWSAKFNYHPNDIINLLKKYDYNCYINDGNNLLTLITHISDSTHQTNFFFLHPVKHDSLLKKYAK